MQQIVLILHVAFAGTLIVLILLQQGKGATMGASFGAGASQTVFGSQGAGGFLMKITGFFALLFFCTSLALGHFSDQMTKTTHKTSIISNVIQISKAQKKEQAQLKAAQAAEQQVNEKVVPSVSTFTGTKKTTADKK
jgi:preprotein translocase subunit SecG